MTKNAHDDDKIYGTFQGPYTQASVKKRIEALFLDNLGRVLTSELIRQAAQDPLTGRQPENWHQRLSELRTDDGYTILTWRNRGSLRVEEYLMPTADKRPIASKRMRPTRETWQAVLDRCNHTCEWFEENQRCSLKQGDIDPIGGGKVRLTPDHKTPHSVDPNSDPTDSAQWQALCGRHQVIKKNYWDSLSGKLNIYAIVQSATREEKTVVFKFLLDYFGYHQADDGTIHRNET